MCFCQCFLFNPSGQRTAWIQLWYCTTWAGAKVISVSMWLNQLWFIILTWSHMWTVMILNAFAKFLVLLKRCLPILRKSQWFAHQTRSCVSGSHWDPSPAHPHIGSQGPCTIQDHKGEVKKDSSPTGILNSSCWASPTLIHFLHLHAPYISSTPS